MNRAAIKTPADWAESYRVMGAPYPGKWTFKYHPWLRAIHNTKAQFNVVMKAAQMGITETGMNISFHTNDVLKQDVLYLLPNEKPDASVFSSMRFDGALKLSPYLKNLYSEVNNVAHKKAGAANLLIRGSNSKVGLKSIPTPKIIMDEFEEMWAQALALALERKSGQLEEDVLVLLMSTPSLFRDGVHAQFLETSQEHFIFPCPHCSKLTEMIFPECVEVCGVDQHDPDVAKSRYLCKECKHTLDHESKPDWLKNAYWEPTVKGREARGFQIPQMYSSVVSPKTFAIHVHKAKKDPAFEQELWNSKLGLPHEIEGARITKEQIQTAKRSYLNLELNEAPLVCMGVDVGTKLHVDIGNFAVRPNYDDLNMDSVYQTMASLTVMDFEELDELMFDYRVRACVIDANPERRKADEFAKRWPERVFPCFYGNNVRGKIINLNEESGCITVDRTAWLDATLSRFKNTPQSIQIPRDISLEYVDHLTSLVRVYEKDKNDHPVAKYRTTENELEKGKKADHFAHACNYREIALQMAYGKGISTNIEERVV